MLLAPWHVYKLWKAGSQLQSSDVLPKTDQSQTTQEQAAEALLGSPAPACSLQQQRTSCANTSMQHPSCSTSSTETQAAATGFEQLEGLPLQLIALKLSNPAPLLATCHAAYRSVSQYAGFEVQWFLRWAPVLAPHRPWQYTAVTWLRLGGADASADALAHFMLAVIAATRQQQREAGHVLPSLLQELQQLRLDAHGSAIAAPAASAQPPAAPAQQHLQDLLQHLAQQQQAQHKPKPQHRQYYSPFPDCLPLPSLVRDAKRHLQQGRAIKALHLLSPGPPLLLYPYASLAGNLQLLAQLVQAQRDNVDDGPYPAQQLLLSSQVERFLSTAQLCAFAAMRAGNAAALAWVLKTAAPNFTDEQYQVKQMLHFAIKRSNSACLQELLHFLPCANQGVARLRPWHHHLAMAAGRTDPWAAGVVQLLLQVLGPKQTAAKYMGGVYEAACRSGHLPVLQQLLQVAAAEPQKHMNVLLSAAVQVGNVRLLQQLLQQQDGDDDDDASSSASFCSCGDDSSASRSTSSRGSSSCGTGREGPWLPQPASLFVLQQRQHSERASLLRRHQQQEAPLHEVHAQLSQQAKELRQRNAHQRDLCRERQVMEEHRLQEIEEDGQLLNQLEEQLVQLPLQSPQYLQIEQEVKQLSRCLQGKAEKLVQLKQQQQRHPSLASLDKQLRRALEPVTASQAGLEEQLQDLRARQHLELTAMQQQHMMQIKRLEQEQRRQFGNRQQQIPAELLPQLPLASLSEDQWVALLDCALDGMSAACGQSALFPVDPQHDSRQAAMADALWEALSRHPDTHITVQHRIKNVLGTVGVAGGDMYTSAEGGLFRVCADAKAGKLLWLRWHPLLPQLVTAEVLREAPEGVQKGLQHMIIERLARKQLRDLPVLQDVAAQLGVGIPAEVFLRGIFSAAAADAACRGDVAGLQQVAAFRAYMQTRMLKAAEGFSSSGGGGSGSSGSSSGSSSSGGVCSSGSSFRLRLSAWAAAASPAGSGRVLPLWQLSALALVDKLNPKRDDLNGCGLAPALQAATGSWTSRGLGLPEAAQADGRSIDLTAMAATASTASGAAAVVPGHISTAVGAKGAVPQAPAGVTAQQQSLLTVIFQHICCWGTLQQPRLTDVLLPLLQHRLDVLAWFLHPKQRSLWAKPSLADRLALQVGTFKDRVLRGPRDRQYHKHARYSDQQEQQQLQQHRQEKAAGVTEGFSPLPQFAAAAAELSRVLLLQPQYGRWPGQFGNEIAGDVAATSSAVHLEKVKAMLGVVAGAPRELLASAWQLVTVGTCRRVTASGDIDLLALLLLYDRRARSMPGNPDMPPGLGPVLVVGDVSEDEGQAAGEQQVVFE